MEMITEELKYSLQIEEQSLRHFDRFAEISLLDNQLTYTLLGPYPANNYCTYLIPKGYKGVLKQVGMSTDTVSNFDDISWRVTINDKPIEDLSDWESQYIIRTTAFQRQLIADDPRFLDGHSYHYRLSPGDTVSLYVKRLGTIAGAFSVYGRIRGWYWPI